MSVNTLARTGLVAALTAGLLWWFLHGVRLESVAAEIQRARPGYVAAALALSLAGLLYRSLRWRYLMVPIKWVRLGSLASVIFMGWAISATLPGRPGELGRAVLLSRREDVRASAVLGTVVLERLLDGVAALLLLAGYLALGPVAPETADQQVFAAALRQGGWFALGALAGISATLLAAPYLPEAGRRTLRTAVERLPGALGRKGWEMLQAFRRGATGALADMSPGLTPARMTMLVALHTLVLWTMICSVHALLFRAFGIGAPVVSVAPLVFLISVGLLVPVPAGLGSYHAAVQVGLTALAGVSRETAAGYAIVSHALAFVPPAVIGLLLLAREGLTPAAVTSGVSIRN